MSTFSTSRKTICIVFTLAIMLASMLFSALPNQPVQAQDPPRVNTMPSYTQSITYGNVAINQAIAIWGNVHDGTAPYTYRLDAGDGTIYTGAVSDPKYIGHDHTYATLGSKTVTLIVTDTNTLTDTSQSVLRVFPTPLDRETRVNMAIEKGLLYLYNAQDATGYWETGVNSYDVGATSFALLSFEENGHLPANDIDEDIYAEYVQLGLDWLWSTHAAINTITAHDDGNGVQDEYIQANPMASGNGAILSTYNDHFHYANPAAWLAVIASHHDTQEAMDAIIDVGPLAGTSYYTATVYGADGMLWSQSDSVYRGAWRYLYAQSPNDGYDGSSQQWPVLALGSAERTWGITAPQWVRDNAWDAFIYLQAADGGIGYSSPGSIPNIAKTGGFVGASTWMTSTPPLSTTEVALALDYIDAHWLDHGSNASWAVGWGGNFYGMYGTKKGFSLTGIKTVSTTMGELNDWSENFDYYLLGDASGLPTGMNYTASTNHGFGQRADGSWISTSPSNLPNLGTGLAILILTKGVLIPPPVAVIAPIAAQPPNTPFQVDGSGSYHANPQKSIVEWLWDWDASDGIDWGNPDASGPQPTNPGYGTLGLRTITMRVMDDSDPAMYDTDTVIVDINLDNHAPVAVPIPADRLPSYAGRIGEDIFLDGTESYDPDVGVPGGTDIISYTWDLNGDLVFGDALTSTTFFSHATEYQGQVGLIVVDDLYSYSLPVYVDIAVSGKDLFVQSLHAVNGGGNMVDLKAVVANDATSNQAVSNVLVRFYDGHPLTTGSPIGSNRYVDLSIGATADVTASIDAGAPLTQVYVWLDANENMAEWDEINNIMNAGIDAQMSISKTAKDLNGAPLAVGDLLLYELTIYNNNPANPMTNVIVSDTLPAGVTFVDADPAGYTGPNPLVWAAGDLAPETSWTALITVAVNGSANPIGGNYAECTSDQVHPPITIGPILPPGGGEIDPNPNALQMSKVAEDLNGAPLYPGDEILYTVLITNMLDFDQTGVVITDAIPAGASYVPGSASASQGSVSGPDPLVADLGVLAANDTATLTFHITVDSTSVGDNIENYASGDSNQQHPPITIGPITPPGGGQVVPNPNALDMSKVAEDLNGAPLYPGDQILYTILVTNILDIEQTNVVVTDTIPAGTTYVDDSAWSSQGSISGPDPLVADLGTLAANGVATITFRVSVDSTSVGDTIENYAGADSEQHGPPITIGPITPPGGGEVIIGLTLEKTAEDINGDPLLVGDFIRYVITVTNESSVNMTNVLVTDTLPAGVSFVDADPAGYTGPNPLVWAAGDLNIGASWTAIITVEVDGSANPIGGNYAEVSSDQQGYQRIGPITPPGGGVIGGLRMSKVAEDLNGDPLYPGDEILYTIIITNALDSDQTGVVITDAIPANTTYVADSAQVSQGAVSGPDPLVADIGTLAANGVATLTFRVTVDTGAVGTVIENYASGDSNQQYPPITIGPITPPGGGEVQPIPATDLEMSKVAADLNGAPLYPGDEILYTIVVTNILDVEQMGVIVTDAIPAGTTYVASSAASSQGVITGPDPLVIDLGTLAANGVATITFNVTVNTDAVGQTIENYADADSEELETPIRVGPITPPAGGEVQPLPSDLGLSKVAQDLNGEPLYPGDEILYTIVVTNMLDVEQMGVIVTDAIPAGTTYVASSAVSSQGTITGPDPLVANIGTLAANGVATITFNVTVNTDAVGQTIENYADADSGELETPIRVGPITPPAGGEVQPLPSDLGLGKVAEDVNGAPLYPGDEILYTIVVTNMLDVEQMGVIVTDAIPADTTYVASSAASSQGVITGPDPLVANIGTLAANGVATITFNVTVNTDAVGQTIENYADADSGELETPIRIGPITPPAGGEVLPMPTLLQLSKVAEDVNGPLLYPEDEILYTIVITNVWDSEQTGVVITDYIPSFTTYVTDSAQVSQGSVSGPDPLIANIGTLASNASATFSFRVIVDTDAVSETIQNYATAGSNEEEELVEVGPIEPQPGGGVVQPPAELSADLAITKSYERNLSVITYTIVASNQGPDDADWALLYDDFADYMINISWVCETSGGAACSATGSGGLINEYLTSFPSGGVVTYTVSAGLGVFEDESNIVTITPPDSVTDPNIANNTATVGEPFKLLLPIVSKQH